MIQIESDTSENDVLHVWAYDLAWMDRFDESFRMLIHLFFELFIDDLSLDFHVLKISWVREHLIYWNLELFEEAVCLVSDLVCSHPDWIGFNSLIVLDGFVFSLTMSQSCVNVDKMICAFYILSHHLSHLRTVFTL